VSQYQCALFVCKSDQIFYQILCRVIPFRRHGQCPGVVSSGDRCSRVFIWFVITSAPLHVAAIPHHVTDRIVCVCLDNTYVTACDNGPHDRYNHVCVMTTHTALRVTTDHCVLTTCMPIMCVII